MSNITNNKLIKLLYKNTTPGTLAQVFFATNIHPTFDEERSVHFTVASNSGYTEYTDEPNARLARWLAS